MRNKILFIAAIFLFIGGIHVKAQVLQPRNYYKVLVALDTITNTEADTIPLALSLAGVSYKYNYALTRTSISGTANTTAILQESNETTGTTNWYTLATASGTGATGTFIQAATSYGARHRIILTGTGTQSTSYRLTVRATKL